MAIRIPRCQVVPLPDHQVSFQIDGQERLRWHFGAAYPRPFYFPLLGPSGKALTRMGHPGAPDHDHHRSIWFAHHKVSGVDFWGDRSPARIRQKGWQAYQDSDDEAAMAVLLGWYDGHDPRDLLEQQLVVAVQPGPQDETFVEVQSTFRPTAETLELGQTNFGFLAVRVAKALSVHFGGGTLTNSGGHKGEPAIFGKRARWMDYSGAIAQGKIEGITFFDHPGNPRYPTPWHVRADGWMGAALCLESALTLLKKEPLRLRYLLHAHTGGVKPRDSDGLARTFAGRPGFRVGRASLPHVQFRIEREAAAKNR